MSFTDPCRARVAIVYHSGFGHTARQAEAVRRGVDEVPGAASLLLPVEDAGQRWDDLTAWRLESAAVLELALGTLEATRPLDGSWGP